MQCRSHLIIQTQCLAILDTGTVFSTEPEIKNRATQQYLQAENIFQYISVTELSRDKNYQNF